MKKRIRVSARNLFLIGLGLTTPIFPISAQCLPPQGCHLIGYFPCDDYYANCANGCPADECEYNCYGKIKVIAG
jgi:hypothetical protein